MSDIAARASSIEERIKEEVSNMNEFKARGARGTPIKWGDSDEEEKREWRRPAVLRLGEKRVVEDDRTVERRKRQRKAREVENLSDDERALSAKVSDIKTKLFKAGLTENENRGKVMKLEKVKTKDDSIKVLERRMMALATG